VLVTLGAMSSATRLPIAGRTYGFVACFMSGLVSIADFVGWLDLVLATFTNIIAAPVFATFTVALRWRVAHWGATLAGDQHGFLVVPHGDELLLRGCKKEPLTTYHLSSLRE
jgi:hypothetical protein